MMKQHSLSLIMSGLARDTLQRAASHVRIMHLVRQWTFGVLAAAAVAAAGACGDPTGTLPPISDEPGPVRWASVSAGVYGSCASTDDGRVFCWGLKEPTVCGDTGCEVEPIPTLVPGVSGAARVSVTGARRCALTAAMEAHCWGTGYDATLGDGTTSKSATPVRVAIAEPVTALATGYEHACLLTTDGAAACWGRASEAMGDGSSSQAVRFVRTPASVATALRFGDISAGTTQTCAVSLDADAYCWGSSYGTLGIGARDTSCAGWPSCTRASTPQLVEGGHKWKAVNAGNAFTCGVTTSHAGYCWGAVTQPPDTYGILGAGSFTGSKSPIPVAGNRQFQSIDTGTRHACGVTLDGLAYCWGTNGAAELGIGLRGGNFHTPQPVVGGLKFLEVSAGETSCGISVNRNLYCWGSVYEVVPGSSRPRVTVAVRPLRMASPE